MSMTIGTMPMPPGFRYAEVLKKGRPQHGIPGQTDTYDAFFAKHPPMENSRRAKIFAPFDALRGFGEAVASKRVLYEDRHELTECEKEKLDRQLAFLQKLQAGRRQDGKAPVSVRVTFFQLCEDTQSEDFRKKGTCRTVTGILRKADPLHRRIVLDSCSIDADDIVRIDTPAHLSPPPPSKPVCTQI